MGRFVFSFFLIALSFGNAAGEVPVKAGDSVDLAPHRAVYDMALGRVRSGGDIVGAKGRMSMEWVKSCAGWTVKQSVSLLLLNNEGARIETETDFSSYESADGLSYRFTSRTLRNGIEAENIRGEAKLRGKGGPGTADFSRPKGKRFDLPKGAIFPTEHIIHLIRGARSGERRIFRIVFDGATEDGPLVVNAFIFKHLPKAPGKWAKRPLTNRPSWALRLAFYPVAKSGAIPEYELGLRLFDNGVADDFELDYGSFTVDGRLKSLKALPEPKC